MEKKQTSSFDRRQLLGGTLGLGLLGVSATAVQAARAQDLNASQRAMLRRAEAYLEGIGSVRGRFVETSPRGQTADGAYYLRRPGRMRFEYNAPSRLVVVADGVWIRRWDPRLEVYQRTPMNQTPLSVLLDRQVRFSAGYIQVDDVRSTSNGFQIQLRDRRRLNEGSLTLGFGGEPLRLREWTVRDAQGGATRVQLVTLIPASNLADSLFRLNDPR